MTTETKLPTAALTLHNLLINQAQAGRDHKGIIGWPILPLEEVQKRGKLSEEEVLQAIDDLNATGQREHAVSISAGEFLRVVQLKNIGPNV